MSRLTATSQASLPYPMQSQPALFPENTFDGRKDAPPLWPVVRNALYPGAFWLLFLITVVVVVVVVICTLQR
jgi:hypothetical protein